MTTKKRKAQVREAVQNHRQAYRDAGLTELSVNGVWIPENTPKHVKKQIRDEIIELVAYHINKEQGDEI